MSSVPNSVPCLQPTFSRRMSGRCLGNFTAENVSASPPVIIKAVPRTAPPFCFPASSYYSVGLHYSCTAIVPQLHYSYSAVTLLLYRSYTTVTLLLYRNYTTATPQFAVTHGALSTVPVPLLQSRCRCPPSLPSTCILQCSPVHCNFSSCYPINEICPFSLRKNLCGMWLFEAFRPY